MKTEKDIWIKCSDQMPDVYQFVLVLGLRDTDEPSSYGLGRWNGEEWELIGDDNEAGNGCYSDLFWGMDHSEITHWMKLPEKPKIALHAEVIKIETKHNWRR